MERLTTNIDNNLTVTTPPSDANETTDYQYYYYDEAELVGLEGFTLVVEFLDRYYIPAVIALGLLGNVISLVVFSSTYLKQLSLSVYLSALAVSDSGFLLVLAIGWLEYAGIALFHTRGWCQLVVYLGYVFTFLSAWFVVSFSVERYIAICHPLRRPGMCTARRAKMVVAGLSCTALPAYACTLWTSGLQTFQGFTVCTPLNDWAHIHTGLTYVDGVVSLFLPFMSIMGFNIKIVHKIAYFYGKRYAHERQLACRGRTIPKVALRNRVQLKMTKLLLVISSVFLVVNLPSYVIRLRVFIISFTDYQRTRFDVLIQQFFQFIFYLNFSINFFLYSLCSNKFREALRRLLWQLKYKVVAGIRYLFWRVRSYRNTSPPTIALRDMGPRPFANELVKL